MIPSGSVIHGGSVTAGPGVIIPVVGEGKASGGGKMIVLVIVGPAGIVGGITMTVVIERPSVKVTVPEVKLVVFTLVEVPDVVEMLDEEELPLVPVEGVEGPVPAEVPDEDRLLPVLIRLVDVGLILVAESVRDELVAKIIELDGAKLTPVEAEPELVVSSGAVPVLKADGVSVGPVRVDCVELVPKDVVNEDELTIPPVPTPGRVVLVPFCGNGKRGGLCEDVS